MYLRGTRLASEWYRNGKQILVITEITGELSKNRGKHKKGENLFKGMCT